eukprot:Hpha_TRINITY_DN37045_c0_g1::TRINITY_DN37045_c0_g1_i1::g.83096::m.83096
MPAWGSPAPPPPEAEGGAEGGGALPEAPEVRVALAQVERSRILRFSRCTAHSDSTGHVWYLDHSSKLPSRVPPKEKLPYWASASPTGIDTMSTPHRELHESLSPRRAGGIWQAAGGNDARRVEEWLDG